ncbi:MAG: C25 family cysteine peptidase, partial [Promethearchaeota archaeon]
AYDEFVNHAQRLADWKTRKGVFTEVVPISEIYEDATPPITLYTPSPTEPVFELMYESRSEPDGLDVRIARIKEYIEEDVLAMSPVPTYILLFGDVDHIPCDYSITHTASYPSNSPGIAYFLYHGFGDDGRIPTDVTYFCLGDDNDYLPDIMHGRISVEDVDEAGYVVDKIIKYEQQSETIHETFYNDIVLSGFFDDYRDPAQSSYEFHSDGIEDEPYISTLEFLYRELNQHYTFHKCYNHDASNTPENHPPEYLFDGQSVNDIEWPDPSEYSVLDPLPFEADHENIIQNIRDGRFLVYHFDHGDSVNFWWNELWMNGYSKKGQFDGWGAPDFRTDNFGDLQFSNEDDLGKYPLVLSMACMTGWFDGETDGLFDSDLMDPDLHRINYEADSFAEKILRIKEGGAVAAIAPTRISYNQMSRELILGISNAFWPGIADVHYSEDVDLPATNLGLALYCGKFHVNDAYAFDAADNNQTGNVTLLEYQLFGDPETPLWTQTPTILSVDHPDSFCSNGPITFQVTVRDGNGLVDGARVCVYKQGEVFVVKDTEDGVASFQIEPSTIGFVNITVTKQNSIPYMADVQICLYNCPHVWALMILTPAAIAVLVLVCIRKVRRKTYPG